MKKLRIIFFILLLSLLIGHIFIGASERIDEKIYLEEIAPGIVFYEKQGVPPYFLSDSNIIAFNSYDIRPDIKGYAGPIKVLIALDSDGIIRGVKIIEHRETRNYVHYMETMEYLSQFIGKSVRDPFEIDRDIDAISRATVSVEALTRTVRESSRLMASKLFHMEFQEKKRKVGSMVNLLAYIILFTSAILFYYLTRLKKSFLRLRDILLVLSILILGLYLSSPFSILHVFNLLLLRQSSSLLFYLLTGTILLSILIAGRFYCGWLCPFGALSEFIGRIPLRKWTINEDNDMKWRRLKYVLLFLIMIPVLLTGRSEFGMYEAYLTLFSFHGNILQWVLMSLMLIANLKVRRFWCRYLCPAGAFTGILAPDAKGYAGSKDCPVNNPPDPPQSECLRCNRCLTRSDGNV